MKKLPYFGIKQGSCYGFKRLVNVSQSLAKSDECLHGTGGPGAIDIYLIYNGEILLK